MSDSDYKFGTSGLAAVIKNNLLKVPMNQRPYAWEASHVRELLTDIKQALSDDDGVYFLGTVVLVKSEPRNLIADGQQRLATSSIILARCRDLLRSLGEKEDAEEIEKEFLKKYVRKSKDYEYLVSMNTEDDAYFARHIVDHDWSSEEPNPPDTVYPSNARLHAASREIFSFLRGEISHLNHGLAAKLLNSWATFLEEQTSVVVVTVSDEVGAFRMFETLNDRGLRASQADILKNYFYSRVKPEKLDLVQGQWNQMYGSLADRFEDTDEQTIRYIKAFWTLRNGLTRDRELASSIKSGVKNPRDALDFVTDANTAVTDYVAIFNAADAKWGDYGDATREDIRVLSEIISIDQIVPLVFAVANRFSIVEARKSFRLFVAWSVRFMLGASGRAGRLDKQYAELAQDVGTGKKTTAKELRAAFDDKVPGDDAFERAVRSAKVSNAVLARYYLVSIERASTAGSGELVPSTDVQTVNLEHVIPKTFSPDLHMTVAEHQDLITRLGNQTVMRSDWNRDLGKKPFAQRREVYEKSDIALTKSLSNFHKFTREEVDARQREMAALAPAIWTLKFD